ncbi:general stress protein [Planococcus sp. CP5-4]|uniref:general stress protein n=1 Tax=unclassified Planococcus (in: firmicutes) TaxID=2662419 RepID=UPI001C23EDAC|nr:MULTISPECIES: general stress protein [unclassified Planococcus (in: firmicutes)]MBU9673345.1 general stress protein [Planococcus sp. CP5-4_YE]MBV0908118.1 general stress protein [Planococcus sp. CP5-4_UN]MBW6062179.1 general stress protein [Planococcus sp. CP5-4]
MKSTNHTFEVAYTEQELEAKVEALKSHGHTKNDIHVLAENADILNAIETQEEVQTHETETITDKFKSMFTGKDAVREELTKLNLTQTEIEKFHDILENEGIVLYAEHRHHHQ